MQNYLYFIDMISMFVYLYMLHRVVADRDLVAGLLDGLG